MAYEEARKLRLEENHKRFQDLGIAQISKALTQISTKTPKQRITRPSFKTISVTEPRRSSRARTNIPSYRDDLDVDIGRTRKSRHNSSWASYIARPLHECKCASYEERVGALKAAEEFQSRLESQNPSFVKSMVRSHVYSCFWLGLPSTFCVAHLPEKTMDIVLEDENGKEYEAVYIGKRSGISGGWRGFALDHKLDDGDALIFHLVEPNRFKVYVFRGDEKANVTTAGKRQREEDNDVGESGDKGSTKRSSARLLRKKKA
ncbi:unnamed protein product [Arabis nemorensis]|uniref:TF-B3 domain-containing protein n=1 Tax=Arabis nemorensis TaxID=586526 RepID=A0A565CRU5_9BRAS|nr:unnamed protein product [Arabis nemorensis]